MIRLWDLVCLLNSQCSSQHALEHCQDRTKRLLLKRGSKGFKLAGFAHSSSRSIQWKVTQLSVISVISVKWHDVKTMWRLCDTRSPTVRYGTGLGDAVHCQTLFFYLFLRLNDFGLSSFATLHVSVGLGWSWQVPLESDPGRWRLQSLEGCGSHSGGSIKKSSFGSTVPAVSAVPAVPAVPGCHRQTPLHPSQSNLRLGYGEFL